METIELIQKLRKRAEIRRKATCRGPEDRLANDLEEAADKLQMYLIQEELRVSRDR